MNRTVPILRGTTQLIRVERVLGREFRPEPRLRLRWLLVPLLAAAFALACSLDWNRPATLLCDPVTALPC
jgi:hypothetical protein